MALFNTRSPVTRLDLNRQGSQSGGGVAYRGAPSKSNVFLSDILGLGSSSSPSTTSPSGTFGTTTSTSWDGTSLTDEGYRVPSTYGTDPSKLGKTTKLSDIYKSQGGKASASSSSSGGGGVVSSGSSGSSGTTINAAGLAKMEEYLSKIESDWDEVKKMQAADKQAGIDEIKARIAEYTNSPVFQAARTASQQLLSGELTSTQRAQIAALEKGYARKYGQAALARGFGGSAQAASQIAGAQGSVAAQMGDMIRSNLTEGISTGGALESTYQSGLSDLSKTLATEIYPTQYNVPDYGQYLQTIGQAYSQAGAGTGATSGTWRRTGSRDVTKEGRGLRWEYVTPEQMAQEQEWAGMSQTERLKAQQSKYLEDLAARRKAARG